LGPQPLEVGGTCHLGKACVSRRQIVACGKKEDKAKIIEKYKVGAIIEGEVKSFSSFGCILLYK
jgi:Ribosomal protein S1